MAEDTAAEHTNRLVALRRLDSADKTGRVITALDATLEAGEPLTIAALARHAGVSRRFIYDHPEPRAEAERRSAQVADRHAGATSASARVTVASLRADLANAKATNHRLTTELGALRRRLGQQLGHDVLAGLDRATIDASAASGRLAGYSAHGCRWAGWVWPGVAQQVGQRRRGESSASSNACRDRALSSVTSWWSRRALSNQSW